LTECITHQHGKHALAVQSANRMSVRLQSALFGSEAITHLTR